MARKKKPQITKTLDEAIKQLRHFTRVLNQRDEQRELRRIEKLLDEDFDTLSQARRALKKQTIKVKPKPVKPLPSRLIKVPAKKAIPSQPVPSTPPLSMSGIDVLKRSVRPPEPKQKPALRSHTVKPSERSQLQKQRAYTIQELPVPYPRDIPQLSQILSTNSQKLESLLGQRDYVYAALGDGNYKTFQAFRTFAELGRYMQHYSKDKNGYTKSQESQEQLISTIRIVKFAGDPDTFEFRSKQESLSRSIKVNRRREKQERQRKTEMEKERIKIEKERKLERKQYEDRIALLEKALESNLKETAKLREAQRIYDQKKG